MAFEMRDYVVEVGRKIGKRIILGEAPAKWNKRMLQVQCECGAIDDVQAIQFLRHQAQMCVKCQRKVMKYWNNKYD